MRIPSIEDVEDALAHAEAIVTDDREEFVREVRRLCADAGDKLVKTKMALPKGKAIEEAARMRVMANTMDISRLEDGGMPHPHQVWLIELLGEAATALERSAEKTKLRKQQIVAELMRRLALQFSIWVQGETPYKPSVGEHWGKRRQDPRVVRFIHRTLTALGYARSPSTIISNLKGIDYHAVQEELLAEIRRLGVG